MKLKGMTLQDLHFGHKHTDRMYKEELPIVLDYLRNNEIHILNLNGDYFDRKLTATEPAIAYAIAFFDDLMSICAEKKIKIRIILGTRSHDLNQYTTLFQHYFERADLDIKYIATVQEEIIEGISFLYVPEEYPENSEEYYKEFKNKSYSAMHGHGTWDFVSFIANAEHERVGTGTYSAPIFVYEEWEKPLENGFAIFGHIHERQNHKNVYYSGSFTAWGYGDASDKGFVVYEIDTETKQWKVEYIDNTKAPLYTTLSIKKLFKGEDLELLTIEQLQEKLNEQIENTDNLKIDLAGLSEDKIKVFRDLFKKNENVKIEVKKKKVTLKEENEPAIYDVYGYILKRELPLDKTIQKFIKEEYSENMSLERIKEIIQ
jgi:hypothetical protein